MTTPTSSAGESLVYKLSLAAQVRAVHDGSLTAEALLDAHLAQTAAHDTQLGAYIRIDADAARQSARALDARRAAGLALGPLAGAVMAVKDQICTQGLATTAGSKVLGNWVPPYDATVVARLRAAGAVILGKANQDEFAMGSSTENSAFFPAKNPWDPTRVPGGSSGGSAIAVACGMAAGALGTDTGGSVRQPASFCGVVGLKPTYGRVSRYGAIAYASSLDQVGPLARTVEDVALLFQTIAGQDAHDATSLPHPLDDFRAAATDPAGLASLAGLRVGVPQEYFGAGVAPDVQAAIEAALAELVALGATLVPVSLPHSRYAVPAYYLIATAEASSNLARYDGLRFGHRSRAELPLDELVAQTRAEGFGPEVKRRIALGTFALSSGYYDAYYLRAQKVRRLIRDDFDRAFEAVDLLAAPVSPFTAFKLGERTSDPVAMYFADIDTVPASLAGVSALSVPAGFDRQKLPIGLQLIGPPLAEARLLRVAAAYERANPWHTERPDLMPLTPSSLTPGAPA